MQSIIFGSFPLGFSIELKELFNTYQVTVEFPSSFSHVECLGGDWGPTYRLEIDPNDLLKISYTTGCCEEEVAIGCELKEVYLKSPFLLARQNECPFVMDIPIKKLNSIIHISFSPNLSINDVLFVDNNNETQRIIRPTELLEICL